MESAILEGVSKNGNMGEEGINSPNVSAMGVQGEEREGGGSCSGTGWRNKTTMQVLLKEEGESSMRCLV